LLINQTYKFFKSDRKGKSNSNLNFRAILHVLLVIVFIGSTQQNAKCKEQKSTVFSETFTFGLESGRNSITAIEYDQLGFLWIGTKNGLIRNYGSGFDRFTYSIVDSTSIPDNFIRDMELLHSGNLLLITDKGGIGIFDTKKFVYKAIKDSNGLELLKGVRSYQIEINSGSTFLIASENGLFQFDEKNDLLNKFEVNSTERDRSVTAVMSAQNGKIWCGIENVGIGIISENSIQFLDFSKYSNFFVWDILETESDVWVATQGHGIIRIEKETLEYSFLAKKNNQYRTDRVLTLIKSTILQDKIIAGTWENGLFLIDETSGTIEPLKTIDKLVLNENEFSVLTLKEDKGYIWVGSESNGLIRLSTLQNGIKPIVIQEADFESVTIRKVVPISDSLWFLGSILSGIRIYNPKENHLTLPKELAFLKKDNCTDLVYFNNQLWIGTFSKGFFRWDLKTRKVEEIRISHDSEALSVMEITVVENRILVSIKDKGLYVVNEQEKLEPFGLIESRKDDFLNFVQTFYVQSDSLLWLGSYKSGVRVYSLKDKKNANWLEKDLKVNGYIINSIRADNTGRIWIATAKNGLTIFDTISGKNEYLSESNGLFGDAIVDINIDSTGKVWIFGEKGIGIYEPAFGLKKVLRKNQDIPFDDFYRKSVSFSHGKFIISAPEGILQIQPEKLNNEEQIQKVFIQHIESNQKKIEFSEFQERANLLNEFTFSYNDRSISIQCIVPHYTLTDLPIIEFRLKGLESEWNIQPIKERIRYRAIPPGEYEFQVRRHSSLSNGLDISTRIPMRFEKPFWETYWFSTIVIVFFASLFFSVWLIFRTKKKALEILRLRIASDLHDQIGASLTKISIQAGLLKSVGTKEKISEKVNKIELSVKEIIGSVRDIIWTIDSRRDSIQELTQRMRETAFDLLEDQNINIHFEESVLKPDKKLSLEVRESLFLIYKEAITNAVKHSACSDIHIVFKVDVAQIRVNISDNGKGMDLETVQNRSNGLKNMRLRAESIYAKFEIFSELEKGTHIEVRALIPRLWD